MRVTASLARSVFERQEHGMRRMTVFRLPALVLAAAALAGGAQAAEPAKPENAYMDLQPIGLPAIVHGRLVNYVFASVRLILAKGADASKLPQHEPFLRDALVRAGTRTPFNLPEDGVHLDERRLKAEIMREAATELGPGQVVSVVIRSQTPQRRTGLPGGAQP